MGRKIAAALVALLALMMLCSGCAVKTNDRGSVDYLTQKEKDTWREPMTRILYQLDEEGVLDFSSVYCYAAALFDVTDDGVPELIRVEAGGSSGGVTYYAYGLDSQELVGEFYGGHYMDGHALGWCVYRHAQTGEMVNIGQFSTQGGYYNQYRCVDQMIYDKEQKKLDVVTLFHSRYITEEEITTAELYYKDEAVEPAVYMVQQDRFFNEYIRMPETGMQLIRWVDVEDNINRMVDALLQTDQQFIKK